MSQHVSGDPNAFLLANAQRTIRRMWFSHKLAALIPVMAMDRIYNDQLEAAWERRLQELDREREENRRREEGWKTWIYRNWVPR